MSSRLLSRRRLWWILYALWFVTLQVLSSQEGHGESEQFFPHLDKLAHLVFFAAGGSVLAIALRLAWEHRFPYWNALLWTSVVATGAVVGAFDEWHQSFVPLRYGNSMGDWAADILGSVLACLLLPLYWKLLRIRSIIGAASTESHPGGSYSS